MKRDEAITKLRAARKALQDAMSGLTQEDLARPNVVNKWSIKDLIAHLASWDEEELRVIQAFAMQNEPQYSYTISDRSDFAVWNNEQVELRRSRSLQEVIAEFDAARRDLIQAVEGVTDQVLMRPKMTSWNREYTGLELLEEQAAHDLEHAADIRGWRRKRERWARARQKYMSKRREARKSPKPPAE